jgi:hypothetical protein
VKVVYSEVESARPAGPAVAEDESGPSPWFDTPFMGGESWWS